LSVPWDKLSREQWTIVAQLWQLASGDASRVARRRPELSTSEPEQKSEPTHPPKAGPTGASPGDMLDAERMLQQIPEDIVAASLAAGGHALAWPHAVLARAWEGARGGLLRTLATRLDAASGAPENG